MPPESLTYSLDAQVDTLDSIVTDFSLRVTELAIEIFREQRTSMPHALQLARERLLDEYKNRIDGVVAHEV